MDNPKNLEIGSRSYAFLDSLLQREHSRSRSKDREDFQLVPRKRNWMPGYGCADTQFPSTQRRGHGAWLVAASTTLKEHPGTSPPSCRSESYGKPRDPGHPGLAEFRCQSFRLCPQTVLWTIGLHFLKTVSLHVSLLNTKCR